MTMRLTIKNEDTQRTASVVTHNFLNGTEGVATHEETQSIGPGESAEVWIHAHRRAVITEGPIAEPATPTVEGELVNDTNGNPSYATVTTPARPFPGSGDPGDPGPGTPDVEPKRETTE